MSKNVSFIKLALFFAAVCILAMSLRQLATSRAATPILSITGSGSDTTPGGETTFRLELLNHTDQIVYDGVLTATLPAGFTYVPGSTIALGEGWPMENREPTVNGQTLSWGPYHLPAAGITAHNPFGIHTMMDSCDGIPALHLEGAKTLVGSGGYITTTEGARYMRWNKKARITLRSVNTPCEKRMIGRPAARMSSGLWGSSAASSARA